MTTLFSGPKVVQQTPTPVAEMPDKDDPAILAARKKALADAAARDGRQNTIMGGGMPGAATPTVLGDTYSSQTLGGR